MKFNPPPEWPSPPSGWKPEPGWQPDPSWPPLPAGWILWIDDDARSSAKPGNPGPYTATANAVGGASPGYSLRPQRGLFFAIAVFTAVTALGTIVGLGYWAYANWSAKKVVDDISKSIDSAALKIDPSGTWTGSHTGAADKVVLEISSSTQLSGAITYYGKNDSVICVESWTETSRDYNTIYVDEKRESGSDKCSDTEWKITVEGNTLTAEKNWDSTGKTDSSLSLHKSS
ncbi:hypothetical protein [Skermania sp. ID1734]|uniref:hypothetical protein n=1 Tax=Skermania sp. ID1734 TaxID=2597516 RepID=UPI00210231FF|nr:hypothetical protein [Skermania sp. ID1734]